MQRAMRGVSAMALLAVINKKMAKTMNRLARSAKKRKTVNF